MNRLRVSDPVIAFQLWREQAQQDASLELTIEANYPSEAVVEAQRIASTSGMSWRASVSYPETESRLVVQTLRRIAALRACKLFGSDYANVVPSSSLQASRYVQYAVLRCGDVVFDVSSVGVRPTLRISTVNPIGQLDPIAGCWVGDSADEIDLGKLALHAHAAKPRMIRISVTAGWSPVEWAPLARIARRLDAHFVVDLSHFAGPVAAGLRPSPVPFAQFVTLATNGTLRGPRGGLVLANGTYAALLERVIRCGDDSLSAMATKAVALREAQDESFHEYQRQVLANADAVSAVLSQRGFVAHSRESWQVRIERDGESGTSAHWQMLLASGRVVADSWRAYRPDLDRVTECGVGVALAALTARGFTAGEAEQAAHLVADILDTQQRQHEKVLDRTRASVQELCRQFP